MKKIISFIFIFTLLLSSITSFNIKETYASSNIIVGGTARKIQFSNKNLYLDMGTDKNAIAKPGSNSLNQYFYFSYYPEKNAYKIYSASNPNLILAWNNYFESNNIFFTNNGDLDEHYWIIEKDSDNNQYIRNYKKKGDYSYLGAVDNQGYLDVVLTAKPDYYKHYTQVTISPEYPNIFNKNSLKIENVGLPKNYLTVTSNSSNNNVSMNSTNLGDSQSFYLEYDNNKSAYKIKNLYYGTYLGLKNGNEDTVISYKFSNSDDQYWRLKYNTDDTFNIINSKYPNKVLEVQFSIEEAKYIIKLNELTNYNNQKFKLY